MKKDLKTKNYRKHTTILQRGYYIDQIEYILKKFPKENLKIVIGERYKKDPLKETNKIFKFLGLKTVKKLNIRDDVHARVYEKTISRSDYDMLKKLYEPYNKKLYKFLGGPIKEWESTYNNIVKIQKEGNRLKKR